MRYSVSITNPLFLAGLAFVAALSPLLTFAAFWQLKEWRVDRLREHLDREGWFFLLFGKTRLILLALFLLILPFGINAPALYLFFALAVFALLTLVQTFLRKQHMPHWTAKALTLVSATSILNLTVIALALHSPDSIAIAVLLSLLFLQPFVLTLAWLLFWPMDRALKQRTFLRATDVRNAHPDMTVIGITGSVGKTTTKELLTHLLKDRNPIATPAHVNTEMGVARWMISSIGSTGDHSLLIVEMGAYRRGEIANLCRIVQPKIGIVTFVGSQHLALFGSQEDLLLAKGELLESLPEDGAAFLNGDCELCQKMRPMCRSKVTVVGTGGRNDIEAYDIEETTQGIRFSLGNQQFMIPLHGTHNITNVLLAVAAAESLGIPRNTCAEKLRTFLPPHHTFEVREKRGVIILDDTHNASATSFKAAIAWADTQPYEQKILLSSGIIELGEEQYRTHLELGSLSRDVFDKVYFLNTRNAQVFAEGYGKEMNMFSKKTEPIAKGSLLVCVGRMPQSLIEHLLPKS